MNTVDQQVYTQTGVQTWQTVSDNKRLALQSAPNYKINAEGQQVPCTALEKIQSADTILLWLLSTAPAGQVPQEPQLA